MRKDTFSSEIYAAFDILFNNWLQSRESKVRCALGIKSCSGNIERSCMSREDEVGGRGYKDDDGSPKLYFDKSFALMCNFVFPSL